MGVFPERKHTERKRISDHFNTVYGDVYNGVANDGWSKTVDYVESKTFLEEMYPNLNNAVLEFLLMNLCVNPNSKIFFCESNKNALGLICDYENGSSRGLEFNVKGAIVKDYKLAKEKSENASTLKEKGE